MVPRQERQLLKAARAGSQEACAKLIRIHYAAIYRFLLHLSGQVGMAEDLTQETFAAAWAGMARFRGWASFSTWLHRIAHGKFVDAKRRAKSLQVATEQLRDNKSSSTAHPGPLDEAIAKERSGQVYAAVQKLGGAEQVVIVLHYFQSLSFSQMATVLAEPVGTVKWRTSQALGRLKISLDGRV